jgi:GGDEF domain-containing protein
VQLFVATFAGLAGIWVVRERASSPAATDGPGVEPTSRKTFPADTSRLVAVGDALLRKARRNDQPLTVAVFDFADLPELQSVSEGQLALTLGSEIARKLQGIAAGKAVVVRTGPTRFAVLLRNFDSARTRQAIAAAFGKGCCLEFEMGNGEMLLVPDWRAQTVRPETVSVEAVYLRLCAELVTGQRHAELRHEYIKRERESHTRPMRLEIAPTMPAPIGAYRVLGLS